MLRSRHFAAEALRGQRTGRRLIAERIETAAQFETLRGLNVEHGQGYLLGAPQPAPGNQFAQSVTR